MSASISFVVPCFNEQDWISRLLVSLNDCDIDFELIELLIIDNWSSDRTVEVVWNLIPSLKYRVRIVHESRPGVSFARNTGGKAAAGSTLVFIDADNVLTQDFVIQAIKAHQMTDFCGSTIRTLADSGDWRATCLFYLLEAVKIVSPRPFGKSITKKDIFLKVGGFNTSVQLGENVYFTSSIKAYASINSLKFIHTKAPIYCSIRRFQHQGFIKVLLPWFVAYIGVSGLSYSKFHGGD